MWQQWDGFVSGCACGVCACTLFPNLDSLWHVTQAILCYSRPGDLGFMNNLPPLILSCLDLLWDAFEAPVCWGLYSDGYQTKETNNGNKRERRERWEDDEGNLLFLECCCSFFRDFLNIYITQQLFLTQRYVTMSKSEKVTVQLGEVSDYFILCFQISPVPLMWSLLYVLVWLWGWCWQ